MIIKRRSPISGIYHELDIDVTLEQLKKWHNGQLIQNAMPNIAADEREFIETGITPDEWKDIFGGQDE